MMGGSVSVSRERERDVIRRAQLRGNMPNFCPQAPRDPAGFGIVESWARQAAALLWAFSRRRGMAHIPHALCCVYLCAHCGVPS